MNGLRVQACLNGARPEGFHPRLPLTPEALAQDAAACARAGAVALHLHPRDASGAESLAPEVIGRSVAAVRAAAPGLPVSVSTGAWIEGDAARQLHHIRRWPGLPPSARPDEASVNLSEGSAAEVIAALISGGIGVEAGLATPADARRLIALPFAPLCRRILVEMDDIPEAAETARTILALLDAAGLGQERQLHGFDGTAWPMAHLAAERGLMLRIGLEDTRTRPDGSVARDNAQLLEDARAVPRASG